MSEISITEISSRPPGAPRPKVSVAMVAYQHEEFIEQAVESVMMQKTTFPFEMVIGEDCSLDRTREILLHLQGMYPDRIRLLLPERNRGMMPNFTGTLQACEGQYVALLEGDDYWMDPQKLQKQVDLLEAHPAYSACFALTRVIADGNSSEEFYIPSRRSLATAFTTEDLLRKNFIATASVIYRNVMRQIDFAPLQSLKMIDWPLHVLVSLRGPFGYIPEEMAVYRQHGGGLWTAAATVPKLEATIQMYAALRTLLPAAYRLTVVAGTVKAHQLIALELLKRGNRRLARGRILQSLASIPLASLFSFGWYIKRSILLFFGACGMPLPRVEAALRR